MLYLLSEYRIITENNFMGGKLNSLPNVMTTFDVNLKILDSISVRNLHALFIADFLLFFVNSNKHECSLNIKWLKIGQMLGRPVLQVVIGTIDIFSIFQIN
jgi:hypothetical protein